MEENEERAKAALAAKRAAQQAAKPPSIFAALVKAQSEFSTVAKDRENPYFKSEYATLQAIVTMVRPILSKHGLAYTQGVEWRGEGRCVLATHIFDADGMEIVRDVPYTCDSKKPQDQGSAITYAKRYGLQCALGIVIANDETDDDGNRASGRTGAAANAPKAASPF